MGALALERYPMAYETESQLDDHLVAAVADKVANRVAEAFELPEPQAAALGEVMRLFAVARGDYRSEARRVLMGAKYPTDAIDTILRQAEASLQRTAA